MTLTEQQLSLEELITTLIASATTKAVFERPTREAPSAESVADAFDSLDSLFTYNRAAGGIKANTALALSDTQSRFASASIAAFNTAQKTSGLVIDRASNGSMIPNTIERISENVGVRTESSEPGMVATASAGCTWQWWFNTYWWGFKLSFNSCAINWLTAGGKAFDQILAALHLPAVATPVVKLLAAILKPFDKGNGSTIYFTWIGASWVTAK